MFFHGCSDHQDQLFYLFELKKLPWPYGQFEKIFSMGISCMSLAVWLGEDRKCSAAVAGLDLLLRLSIVRRCSLNRSFNRRFVSPMYCKLQQLHCIM